EAFASKNPLGASILDGFGMGVGYTIVLVLIALVRELLGNGTLLAGTAAQITIIPEAYRIGILNSAPGGFIVFGVIAAANQAMQNARKAKEEAAK
ncbi:MAG TPA: electron transport complex subunit RsxE, partial [Treponema sp.]|nr:electron transport complex subunit RsxE [Treponema sp.]